MPIKRTYDLPVMCKKCNKPSLLANIAVGYQCHHCNTYNNAKEANDRFLTGAPEFDPDNKSSFGIPNFSNGIQDGHKDYFNLRDEFEIRADMFAKGKTRDAMGYDTFERTLKKELIKNKCYRGPDKVGI